MCGCEALVSSPESAADILLTAAPTQPDWLKACYCFVNLHPSSHRSFTSPTETTSSNYCTISENSFRTGRMARTVSLATVAIFVNWSKSLKFNRSLGADELWIPWDVSLHVRVREPDVVVFSSTPAPNAVITVLKKIPRINLDLHKLHIYDHNRDSFSLDRHSHARQPVIILRQGFSFVSWVKQAVLHAWVFTRTVISVISNFFCVSRCRCCS